MTFVLNKCYGGFGLSSFALSKLNLTSSLYFNRNDNSMVNALVTLITEYGSENCSGRYAKLEIIEIPDNITDWELDEYDGIESITYVINGKIYHA